MTTFFGIFAVLSNGFLLTSVILGYGYLEVGRTFSSHWLFSLGSSLLVVSVHCLVFGIFTGSGKEAREFVGDYGLSRDYVKETKAFRRKTFPPALYSILLVVLTVCLGGALSSSDSTLLRFFHSLVAWGTFFYNLKSSWVEHQAVADNASLISMLNSEISKRSTQMGTLESAFLPGGFQTVEEVEWGKHVYALAKFLIFLSWNVWLPYVYIRFVMGRSELSWLPFILLCSILFVGGAILKSRYRFYRPGHLPPLP